ncbi:MAG: DUF4145 domain-containing protein, partial [Methylocapsa sp.]|nr:DUF4145 domain-containing protein [Methylocapsa sp.]
MNTSEQMETVSAPCSQCLRETRHDVLHSTVDFLDPDAVFAEVYKLIKCAGCGTLSMANYSFSDEGFVRECYRQRYYPSPVTRKIPPWVEQLALGAIEAKKGPEIGKLLQEIYEAVRGGQHRLAVMGIRALFEQVMISKVGDRGSFVNNMNAFCEEGYISSIQRDAMNDVLEAGHAAIHRSFEPKEHELSTALDIMKASWLQFTYMGRQQQRLLIESRLVLLDPRSANQSRAQATASRYRAYTDSV